MVEACSCWCRQLLWGRLSSLRPAFEPAWVPLTGRLYSSQSPLIRQRPCACVRRGPCHTVLSVEHAVLRATPDVRVEQAARLAMPASPWSMPPGLPCRRSRRQSDTIPNGTGVRHPARTPPRSTSSRPLSSHLRSALCGLVFSVLRVAPPPCSCGLPSPPPAPSMSCPLYGRLSSLRPAFQPALAPFTDCPLPIPMPRRVGADLRVRPFSSDLRALPCSRKAAAAKWSKPPGLPCRRSRRQSDPIPNGTGIPAPSNPHASALHLKPSAAKTGAWHAASARSTSHLRVPPCPLWFGFLRVLRVLRGLFSPCPPCSLWFAFSVPSASVPSPPPVTTFPKSFSLSFSTTCQLPLSPPLALSCMLKVKGAADALVGARTADGASPGQRRRRPQPLPSPDGGELRSLKPAAGGEQAGGGLLT
jgi:hypothetical protein